MNNVFSALKCLLINILRTTTIEIKQNINKIFKNNNCQRKILPKKAMKENFEVVNIRDPFIIY